MTCEGLSSKLFEQMDAAAKYFFMLGIAILHHALQTPNQTFPFLLFLMINFCSMRISLFTSFLNCFSSFYHLGTIYVMYVNVIYELDFTLPLFAVHFIIVNMYDLHSTKLSTFYFSLQNTF